MTFLQSPLYHTACYFVIYSFLGWCVEVCFCTISTGKWVNRGFLNGPVCPIYGFGMVAITTLLNPLRNNLLLLFLGAMALATALELITGYTLKRIFHTKWWDYSKQKFQLGGYICLKFSILWGLGGTAALRIVHPLVERFAIALEAPPTATLLAILLVLFLLDSIVTVNTIAKLNHNLGEITRITHMLHETSDVIAENLGENALTAHGKYTEKRRAFHQAKDNLEDTAQETYLELCNRLDSLREELQQAKRFGAVRLLKAFPKMKSNRYADALEDLRRRLRNRKSE